MTLHGKEKGDRHHLCAAPSGPFRQMVPVPFFPGWELAGPLARLLEDSDADYMALCDQDDVWLPLG